MPRTLRPQVDLIALIALVLAIFTPIIAYNALQRDIDFSPHIEWAVALSEGEILQIHLLFHTLVVGVHSVSGWAGVTWMQAGFLVVLLMQVALALVIYRVYIGPVSRERRGWGVLLTLVLLLVSAVTLPTFLQANLYWGYLLPHVYHNPTIYVLKPLALLLFWCAVRVFGSGMADRWLLVAAGLLSLFGPLAKPHYAFALLPALVVGAAFALLRRRAIDWPLLLAILIPGGIVLVLQWVFTLSPSSNLGAIAFAPLELFRAFDLVKPGRHIAATLLPRLLLSVLFPLVVYGLYWRSASRTTALNLAWLTLAVSLVFTYLFVEEGRVIHANFAWAGQITVLVLIVVSAQFWAGQIRAAGRLERRAFYSGIVLGLHLVSGLIWYAAEITAVTNEWW